MGIDFENNEEVKSVSGSEGKCGRQKWLEFQAWVTGRMVMLFKEIGKSEKGKVCMRQDKFSSLLVRHASAYTQGELIL